MTSAQGFLLFAAAAVVTTMAALSRAAPAPWLINETPSLPRGLYVRAPGAPAPGTIVAFAPPPSARAYLRTLGAPANARLLKRVAAGTGETVCRDGRRLSEPRGHVIALDHDRRGRPLPFWRGCRRLGAEELFVLGDSTASFDSRYFGPVRTTSIEGVYREVWRW